MNRSEFVQHLVLLNISDDYENVDQVILRHVSEDAGKCGLVIERCEIVEALARLIESGMAKAYLLSCTEPFATELDGMPPVETIEEDFKTYFYITKPGLDFIALRDAWWPFDDEGDLRPDWRSRLVLRE